MPLAMSCCTTLVTITDFKFSKTQTKAKMQQIAQMTLLRLHQRLVSQFETLNQEQETVMQLSTFNSANYLASITGEI